MRVPEEAMIIRSAAGERESAGEIEIEEHSIAKNDDSVASVEDSVGGGIINVGNAGNDNDDDVVDDIVECNHTGPDVEKEDESNGADSKENEFNEIDDHGADNCNYNVVDDMASVEISSGDSASNEKSNNVEDNHAVDISSGSIVDDKDILVDIDDGEVDSVAEVTCDILDDSTLVE